MASKKLLKSLFLKAKSKRLARIVNIRSPRAFKRSIVALKKRGLTVQEKRALVLARTRAAVQLKRPNLSVRERRQFSTIATMKLPNITTKRR